MEITTLDLRNQVAFVDQPIEAQEEEEKECTKGFKGIRVMNISNEFKQSMACKGFVSDKHLFKLGKLLS